MLQRHWKFLAGLALAAPELWRIFKWVVDWLGRFDVISSYGKRAGEMVASYLIDIPPPVSFALLVAGAGLIWWDVKRSRSVLQEPNGGGAAVITDVQPTSIGHAPAMPKGPWFTSFAIGHAGDDALMNAAQEASESVGKFELQYIAIQGEIDALAPRDELSALQLLRSPDSEPAPLASARKRLARVMARLNVARHRRDVCFGKAIDDLYDKLRNGTVVAKGFLDPVTVESQEELIPTARWRFLKFNTSDFSSASGEGMTYKAIAVARATDA